MSFEEEVGRTIDSVRCQTHATRTRDDLALYLLWDALVTAEGSEDKAVSLITSKLNSGLIAGLRD